MLFFVRFNNNTLQDLSVEINLNLVKKILFQDFEKVYKIQKEKKFNMILKVYYIVWNYCAKIINLIINITISLLLVIYLFVKFTYSAIFASILVSILAFVSYKYLKSKSNRQNKYFSSSYDSLNSLILKVVNLIKEIKLNNKENYFLDKIEESVVP